MAFMKQGVRPKTLHLLCSAPDDTVAELIGVMSGDGAATVISLYPDDVAATPVDWRRVIQDIMAHERTVCWW